MRSARINHQAFLNTLVIVCLIGLIWPAAVQAQIVPNLYPNDQQAVLRSIDSLIVSLESLKQERSDFSFEFRQLSSRLEALESTLEEEVDGLASRQGSMLNGLDTIRVLMPSDEPIKTASSNVLYLSQRQDSLVAQIERLEKRIDTLPDNHYWGVRNNFRQFDHLLLFTFLGAITSLGVVLLVKNGSNSRMPGQDPALQQEEEADRLSVSITLLVGSVLVVLFILFIL